MKTKIFGTFIMAALVFSVAIPVLAVTTDTTLYYSGTSADASLAVTDNFYYGFAATDLSQNGQQISRKLAVSIFAYTSTGSLISQDGVNYNYIHTDAGAHGGSSASYYKSYHAILDGSDAVLDSDRLSLYE